MSILAIFRMGSRQLIAGIILAILLLTLFLIGYFIVYKKILEGTKKLNVSKLSLWAVFLIYIIVVLGATLGIRSTGFESSTNLQLFSSYKEAWNGFSKVEWRNIILNILMFVPLGVLLPLMFNKCRTFWVTYVIGFLGTVFLEVIQLITKRGIFEIDDIFNNTLGCIIGFGIIMILISYFINKKNTGKIKLLTLVYLQIPLCITIIAFSSIFISYSRQELGNLSIRSTNKVDMSNIKVSTKLKLNEKTGKTYVYNASIGTKEDTLEAANEIFSTVNSSIDESQNDVYDKTIVYRSEDGKYSVWVDYKGLTTWYTDFNKFDKDGIEGLSYKEVKKCISDFGINLPENADFKDNGEGNYSVTVNMEEVDGVFLDGVFTCTIKEDKSVYDFDNDIIEYSKYKEYDIISEQEAYKKILNGDFKLFRIEEYDEIELDSVELTYEIDSKGFHQPVYEFIIKDKDADRSILIPALQ